jgi:hypothetical protein
MARAETRGRARGDLDEFDDLGGSSEPTKPPGPAQAAAGPTPEQRRAAKLADRYGHAR